MTYINQVIDLINFLGQYDLNEYSQLVFHILKQKLRTKNRLILLSKLLKLGVSSNTVIAYKKIVAYGELDPNEIGVNDIMFVASTNEIGEDQSLVIDLSKENNIKDNFALLCIKAAECTKIILDDENNPILKVEDINILIDNEDKAGSQPSMITKLVSACVKICKEESQEFFSTFSTYKGLAIYTYLIKSTLIGEFLSLDNFSERLRTILQKGLNSQIDEIKGDRVVPPVLNLVENIIYEYTKFCNLKSILYNERKVGIVPYYYELEEKEAIYKEITGVEALQIKLHILFQYALKITAIDLCYYASKDNLQVLIDALFHNYHIKQIYNDPSIRKDLNLLRTVNPQIYDLLWEVLQGIEFKASVLANGILEFEQPCNSLESSCKYFVGGMEIRQILNSYKDIYSFSSKNPLISNFNKKSLDVFQHFKNISLKSPLYEGHNDITSYDSQLKHASEVYEEEQKLIQKLTNTETETKQIDNIQSITNDLEIRFLKNSSDITPGFFSKIISDINDNITKGSNYNEWLHILRIVLRILRNYIQTYKDMQIIPPQIRPPFYNSFYLRAEENNWTYTDQHYNIEQTAIKNEYKKINLMNNLSDQDKSIFFASYQCYPIDIQYLENIFYEHNNKWHEKQERRITEQIEKLNTLSKDNKNIRSYVIDLFADERKRTIQLLGIFGAMLAFVSSVVGMQKIVSSPIDFAIFTFIYILGLLIFVFTISYITLLQQHSSEFSKKSKAKTDWRPITIIIILLAIISGLLFYKYKYNNVIKKEVERSESVENAKINYNQVYINQQDVVQESASDIE